MVPFMTDELEMILNQRLIIRKDALDKSDTPMKRLNKWLTKTKHHLEDELVDLEAATKNLLEKAQISAERKRKFKGLCKQLVLNLVLKFWRKLPVNFCLVRNVSCLAPINVIRKPEQSRIRFRTLADKLFHWRKFHVMLLIKQKTCMMSYWTWWNMRRTMNFPTSIPERPTKCILFQVSHQLQLQRFAAHMQIDFCYVTWTK